MKNIIRIILLLSVMLAHPRHTEAQQRGKASFYSKKITGSRTSSGERLHHDSLVCAHRTFPFGTMLKVTNPANGKEVIVRVIDRGPFTKGRIIDLSWRAAKELGIIQQGVAMVKVEKYFENKGVPFKQETTIPELDYEISKNNNGITPTWQEKKNTAEQEKKQNVKEAESHANNDKQVKEVKKKEEGTGGHR